MIKYIVTWIVINMGIVPCPDVAREDIADEFGRINGGMMLVCNVLHVKSDTIRMIKYFDNKDSATNFYNKLVSAKEASDKGVAPIFESKLDSIAINKKPSQ